MDFLGGFSGTSSLRVREKSIERSQRATGCIQLECGRGAKLHAFSGMPQKFRSGLK
jgi:hypothetical protein